jgi:hypothetical protein
LTTPREQLTANLLDGAEPQSLEASLAVMPGFTANALKAKRAPDTDARSKIGQYFR